MKRSEEKEIDYLLKLAANYEKQAVRLEKKAVAPAAAAVAAPAAAVAAPAAGIAAVVGSIAGVLMMTNWAVGAIGGIRSELNKNLELIEACDSILKNIKDIDTSDSLISEFIEKVKKIKTQYTVVTSQQSIEPISKESFERLSNNDKKDSLKKIYDAVTLQKKEIDEFNSLVQFFTPEKSRAIVVMVEKLQGWKNWFYDYFASNMIRSIRKEIEDGIASLLDAANILNSKLEPKVKELDKQIELLKPQIEQLESMPESALDAGGPQAVSGTRPATPTTPGEVDLDLFGDGEGDDDEPPSEGEISASNLAELANLGF